MHGRLARHRVLFISILVLVTGAGVAVLSHSRRCPALTLYFTAGTAANLEPCDCALSPSGGLARRAGFIATNTPGGNTPILLDGGDLLGPPHATGRLRTEYLFRIMRTMGYTVLGLGVHDFAYGHEYLKSVEDRYGFTFTCANIVDSLSGEPLFAPQGIIEQGEARVGVACVIGENVPTRFPEHTPPVRVTDAVDAAGSAAASLRPDCHLVVLLAHVAKEDLPPLLALEDVDVVIATRLISGIAPFRNVGMENGTLMAFTSYQARRIGYAHLDMDESCELVGARGDLVPLDDSIPADPGIAPIVQEYHTQVRRLRAPLMENSQE